MSKFKEICSIELSSFTTLTTGIAVLFSIISAIILSILIFLIVPTESIIIIYLIPTIVVGTFMYTIYSSFCKGLLYNLLAKKLKPIAVEIKDGKEIVKISTSETATMLSLILTIQIILILSASILILPLNLATVINTLMYSQQQTLTYSIYQLLYLLSNPATILVLIFATFIISFVFVLLGTYIYNILAKKGRGIILNLSDENNLTVINSIEPLKLAIASAIIGGTLNLIVAIIMLISGGESTAALGNVLGGFVGGFIGCYLLAVFYNYLSSKIEKIKIELIDYKIN